MAFGDTPFGGGAFGGALLLASSSGSVTGYASPAVPDLGDTVALTVLVFDATGTAGDASTTPVTITLPDGTGVMPVVTRESTGVYEARYLTTQAGRHLWSAAATGGVLVGGPQVFDDVFDVSADSPLVGLAEAKRYARITLSTDDDEIRAFLLAATEMAEAYTGRALRRRVVTETYDGDAGVLLLRQTPVQDIVSVTERGSAVAAGDWVLDGASGALYRGTSVGARPWLPGRQSIVITYTAGPTNPPARHRQAVLELFRHLWQTQRGGSGLPRQAGADSEYDSRLSYSLPRRVEELLRSDMAPGIA